MGERTSDELAAIKAGRLPQRLTMTTLGVADVGASRQFYERLGWRASSFESDQVCFFEMNGTVLGLYGHQPLAEDAAVSPDGGGFRGVTCAVNLESEAGVDAALALAEKAGGVIAKQAEKVFWGGYSGYFRDPDGHLWEVAYNPVAGLNDLGQLVLPPPATGSDT